VSFTDLTAGGALTIASQGDIGGGSAKGGTILIGAAGSLASDQLTSAGTLDADAANGITIDRLASGAATTLTAKNGAILVSTDAAAAGGIDAEGRSVMLTGQNGLNVTRASATAGDIKLASLSGPLSLGTAEATGAIVLDSGGTVSFASVKAGETADIAAQGDISGSSVTATALDLSTPGAIQLTNGSDAGPITATGGSIDIGGTARLRITKAVASSGDLSLIAQQGITADQVSATGTATLKSGSGALAVTDDLVAGGGLVLQAPTIDITAQNGLNILQAGATAGDLKLTTASGTLSAGNSTATGGITLTSGGDVLADSLESGYGAVSVSGAQGVTLGTVASGGALTLASSNGAVIVSSDLTAAGPIQATGQSVDLTAQSDLTLTKAVATGGDLTLRSVNGGLTLADASATGALTATTPIARGELISSVPFWPNCAPSKVSEPSTRFAAAGSTKLNASPVAPPGSEARVMSPLLAIRASSLLSSR
jgi:hypothetical protein